MAQIKTKKIISGLAKKYYIGSKKRNILMIIAVLMTTFMITAVCSIGVSYWNALTQRSIMMAGMKYDIRLPEPTEDQVKKANDMEQILYAGVTVKCAIIEKYETKSTHIRLLWSDDINWKKQCIPAFEFISGAYPQQENEIMMSTQTLKGLGIEKPEIGMTLPVTYYALSGNEGSLEQEMILSGYYRDYTGKAQGFVSKGLYEKTGVKQTDLTQGELNITLKSPLYTAEDIKSIQDELVMKNKQMIYANTDIMSEFIKFAAGIAGMFLMIIISGYLFIYNTLYLSISKEVRFFGQLKLVGATSNQIKMLLYQQVWWNSAIGIPAGMVLGAVVSFWVVPSVLKIAAPTAEATRTIVFHPAIFVGAAFFSAITVLISSIKPAKIAASISPIEAAKYITIASSRYKKSMHGGRITVMAWRNIFRDKKQASIIILSFFVAFTTFLVVNVLIEGNSAEKILNAVFNQDIRVINRNALEAPLVQEIEPSMIEEIASMEEVESVRKVISVQVAIPYQDELLDNYIKRFYELPVAIGDYEKDVDFYKKNSQDPNFMGKIVGIDEKGFDYLNKRLGKELDKEDFMAGKTGIIDPSLDLSMEEAQTM